MKQPQAKRAGGGGGVSSELEVRLWLQEREEARERQAPLSLAVDEKLKVSRGTCWGSRRSDGTRAPAALTLAVSHGCRRRRRKTGRHPPLGPSSSPKSAPAMISSSRRRLCCSRSSSRRSSHRLRPMRRG
jgi:hypothetical protein